MLPLPGPIVDAKFWGGGGGQARKRREGFFSVDFQSRDLHSIRFLILVQLLPTKIVQISDTSMKLSEITKDPKGNIF